MNRSRIVLTVCAACLATVLAAMAWVSVVVVDLDRRDAEAQRQAELQENARLALWRMDSALGPLMAQEDTRPYYEYRCFYSPALAFDVKRGGVDADVVLPSPLLLQPMPFVKLHFQIDPAGQLSSPQVLQGAVPQLLVEQLKASERRAVAAQNFSTFKETLDRKALLSVAPEPDAHATERASVPEPGDVPQTERAAAGAGQPWLDDLNASNQLRQSSIPLAQRRVGRARNEPVQQELRSNLEYQQRLEATLQNAYISKLNREGNSPAASAPSSLAPVDANAEQVEKSRPVQAAIVREGDMKPVWIDGKLLLVRQVTIGDQVWLQGCWLDWEAIQTWLLERVSDLLPRAELSPSSELSAGADDSDAHRLAMLPVSLIAGRLNGDEEPLSSPIRTSLIVAWACTLLAIAAVGVLVIGLAALSERRAAFVSAVTHELRTPLTTFRMYAEMLARGMVVDEQRRQDYLDTLQAESSRLAQLVENVLSYARLERRRSGVPAQQVTAGEMIDRFADRLSQRCEQAEMELAIELDDAAGNAILRTDVSAVEQIVFNLVDNACKYAARSEDRRLHLHARVDSRTFRLSVTDHGPGIGEDVVRRLFKPFSKSAREAANSAPGVGLGLALSRRLARRLGGDLHLRQSDGTGCRFELALPL